MIWSGLLANLLPCETEGRLWSDAHWWVFISTLRSPFNFSGFGHSFYRATKSALPKFCNFGEPCYRSNLVWTPRPSTVKSAALISRPCSRKGGQVLPLFRRIPKCLLGYFPRWDHQAVQTERAGNSNPPTLSWKKLGISKGKVAGNFETSGAGVGDLLGTLDF